MKELYLVGTNNEDKTKEYRELIPRLTGAASEQVVSPHELGISCDPEETGSTFIENAKIKLDTYFLELQKRPELIRENKITLIAEDSGLRVNALGGKPGVFSARYAGDHDFKAAEKKVLQEMKGERNRTADYFCVLGIISPVQIGDRYNGRFLEGFCGGRIAHFKRGSHGFGYDSIFIPKSVCSPISGGLETSHNIFGLTFGQMRRKKRILSNMRFDALKKAFGTNHI